MPLDPTALKSWMQGRSRPEKKAPPKKMSKMGSSKPGGFGKGNVHIHLGGGSDAGAGDDEEPVDPNDKGGGGGVDPIWSGKQAEQVTPEMAAAFFDWMGANEPEILDAITEAASGQSPDAPGGGMGGHGKDELMWVEERGGAGPEFSEEQRKALGELLPSKLEEHADPEPNSPEWQCAVAEAVGAARGGEPAIGAGDEDDLPPDDDLGDDEEVDY